MVPPQGVLFYGPRGTGKTALLERIGVRARELALRCEELSEDALLDREALASELRQHAGPRLTGVQLGPIGATTESPPPATSLFPVLARWIEAFPSGLVLLIDEVQLITPAVGRPFFGALQRAARKRRPLVVLAAGTPDAPGAIRKGGSFMERFFEELPVSRLGRRATREALAGPAFNSGLPMSEEAVNLLVHESQDYPFFIQLLGSAAWRAAARKGAQEIGGTEARAGVASARPAIERFYALRFREARQRGIERALLPVARLFAQPGARASDRDLDACLEQAVADGLSSLGRIQLHRQLEDLGIVWETAPGVWEMGIPSFAAHVLRRAG